MVEFLFHMCIIFKVNIVFINIKVGFILLFISIIRFMNIVIEFNVIIIGHGELFKVKNMLFSIIMNCLSLLCLVCKIHRIEL